MITYRDAHIEDYEALSPLFEEIDELHRKARPNIYRKPDGPVRELEYVEQIVTQEDRLVAVAEEDGKLVGLIHASIQSSKDIPIVIPRRFVLIECIVVTKLYRGRGVGARLLERAEQWAISEGVHTIELGVWEFNQSAISFYHRAGYDTATRRMSKHLYQ